jgi:hypothetical protein
MAGPGLLTRQALAEHVGLTATGSMAKTADPCQQASERLHFWRMSRTITVRLRKDLAAWLEETATRTGVAQEQIVREQLEKAKAARGNRPFMRLAGAVRGPRTLSRRRDFSAS